MNKKGAALLIGLLIITVAGTVALTMAKSVIAGTGTASRLSDSIIAEEASQAGLEYGLYQCKGTAVSTTLIPITMPSPSFDLDTDATHRHVVVSGQYLDVVVRAPDLLNPTTGYQRTCQIQSVGSYSKTYKKHTLNNVQFDFSQ